MRSYLRERGNRGYTEKTIVTKKSKISCFLRFPGDKDVTQVDRNDIESFLNILRNRPASKRRIKLISIKEHLKVVSVFLAWLEDNDLISKNPARRIIKEIRVEKTRRTAISLEDVRKLVKCARNPRDRAIILTMAIAGLRRSEIADIRVGDGDFKTAEIFVRQGKGRKDMIAVMDHELVEALKVWLTYRDSMNPCTEALFTGLHGKRALSSNGI